MPRIDFVYEGGAYHREGTAEVPSSISVQQEEAEMHLTNIELDEDLSYTFRNGLKGVIKTFNTGVVTIKIENPNSAYDNVVLANIESHAITLSNRIYGSVDTSADGKKRRYQAAYVNAVLRKKFPDIAEWMQFKQYAADDFIWLEMEQRFGDSKICLEVTMQDGTKVPSAVTTFTRDGAVRRMVPLWNDMDQPVDAFKTIPANAPWNGRYFSRGVATNWTHADGSREHRNLTNAMVGYLRTHGQLKSCGNCGTCMDPSENFEHGTQLCPHCWNERYNRTCHVCHTRMDPNNSSGWSERNRQYLCPECQQTHSHCERCGSIGELALFTYHPDYDQGAGHICSSCYDSVERAMNDIQDYHSGSRAFTFLGRGPIYAGLELEVDEGTDRYELIGKLRQLWGKNLCCERDGSLSDDGMEVVLPPIGIEDAIGHDLLAKTIQLMQDHDFKGQDAECSCGMHINISRSAFSSAEQKRIAGIVYRFSKEFMALSQRKQGHSYAKMPANQNDSMDLSNMTLDNDRAKRYYDEHGHYAGVSYRKAEVIEFRIFAMSVNIKSVYAKLELVRNLCHWVKNNGADPEHIDDIIKCRENRWLDEYAAKYLKKYKIPSTLWAKAEDIEKASQIVQTENNGGRVPASYRKYAIVRGEQEIVVYNPLYIRQATVYPRIFELLRDAALMNGQSFFDPVPTALEA